MRAPDVAASISTTTGALHWCLGAFFGLERVAAHVGPGNSRAPIVDGLVAIAAGHRVDTLHVQRRCGAGTS